MILFVCRTVLTCLSKVNNTPEFNELEHIGTCNLSVALSMLLINNHQLAEARQSTMIRMFATQSLASFIMNNTLMCCSHRWHSSFVNYAWAVMSN